MLTQEEKNYLLKLARQTLELHFKSGQKPEVDLANISEALKAEQGIFVTLTQDENLRGCIGNILPNGAIYKAVIENSLNAAFGDPRFSQVEARELKSLNIEISVLSLPLELSVNKSSEYLEKLRPEIDGVIIKQGIYQATYLPQVWEDLSDPQEFLDSLCQKAGLKQKCWQEPATKLLTYQAEVFRE